MSSAAKRVTAGYLTVAMTLYLAFMARGAIDVDGATYFSLADDAMISMTYARNLSRGEGLVWNAGGPPVEGYTNFLWTVVMAGVHRLTAPARFTSLVVMVLGAVMLLANAVLIGRIAGAMCESPGDESLVRSLAVALAALSYPVVFWTLRGFEVGLLVLLFSVMVLLVFRIETGARGGAIGLAAVMAVAVLVRTDAIVTCAVVATYGVIAAPARHRAVVALAIAAGTIGALSIHTWWRIEYYNAPLPNTYYLKLMGVSLFERLQRGTLVLASTMIRHLLPLAALAFAAVLLSGAGHSRRRTWLLTAIAGSNILYSLYVGGDVWDRYGFSNRYIVLGEPLIGAVAAVGVAAIIRTVRDRAGADQYVRIVLYVSGVALMALGVGAWLTDRRLVPTIDARPELKPVLAAALLAAGVAALFLARRLAGRVLRWLDGSVIVRLPPSSNQWNSGTLIAAIALTVALCTGPQWSRWALFNFEEHDMDSRATLLGVQLARATPMGATLAVTSAGAIPYFADRPGIDLLGKSDPFIARSVPRLRRFVPGHNKWDLYHSIGSLRPDVIVSLPSECSAEERAFVKGLGYRLTAGGWMVAPDVRPF